MVNKNISWTHTSTSAGYNGANNYLAQLVVDDAVVYREYCIKGNTYPEAYYQNRRHINPIESLSLTMGLLNMAVTTTNRPENRNKRAGLNVIAGFVGDYREAFHDVAANTLTFQGKTVEILEVKAINSATRKMATQISAIKLMRPSMVMVLACAYLDNNKPKWYEFSSENPL